jgi:hypothetical protein
MRINCAITPDDRRALSKLIGAVNEKRLAIGLPLVNQSQIISEIIQRAAERDTINLCGIYLIKSQYDATGDREAS